MKKYFTYILMSTVIMAFSLLSMSFDSGPTKKELLISMPMLTDKNAAIVNDALKKIQGVYTIEACYSLNVMIISFDDKIQSDLEILELIRKQEINSTVELLHSSDIPKIKKEFPIVKIK